MAKLASPGPDARGDARVGRGWRSGWCSRWPGMALGVVRAPPP